MTRIAIDYYEYRRSNVSLPAGPRVAKNMVHVLRHERRSVHLLAYLHTFAPRMWEMVVARDDDDDIFSDGREL